MLVVVDIADFAGERFWHVLKSELQEFECRVLFNLSEGEGVGDLSCLGILPP